MSAHRPSEHLRVWSAAAALLVAGLFALSNPGLAAATTPQMDQTAAEVQALTQLVNQLNRELSAATEAYNFAKQQLEDTRAAVNQTTAELAWANEDLASAENSLNQRLISIYKSGGLDTLNVILGFSSLAELFTYLDTLKLFSGQDARILAQIQEYRTQKQELRARLDSQLQQQEALTEQTESARQSVLAQLTKNKEALRGKEAQLAQLKKAEAEQQARHAAWLVSRPGIVVSLAKQYLGVPYVWGGASPGGFDCSGLVQYVYKQVGISLPHSSAMQYDFGTPVSRSDLKAGDLVFFYTPIHHVGIYIGGGKMIDATGTHVQASDVFTTHYRGARRLL